MWKQVSLNNMHGQVNTSSVGSNYDKTSKEVIH